MTILGDQVSLADFAFLPFLVPWEFVIKRCIELKPDETQETLTAPYPKLQAFYKAMKAQPYTTAVNYTDEALAKFIQIHKTKDQSANF